MLDQNLEVSIAGSGHQGLPSGFVPDMVCVRES